MWLWIEGCLATVISAWALKKESETIKPYLAVLLNGSPRHHRYRNVTERDHLHSSGYRSNKLFNKRDYKSVNLFNPDMIK